MGVEICPTHRRLEFSSSEQLLQTKIAIRHLPTCKVWSLWNDCAQASKSLLHKHLQCWQTYACDKNLWCVFSTCSLLWISSPPCLHSSPAPQFLQESRLFCIFPIVFHAHSALFLLPSHIPFYPCSFIPTQLLFPFSLHHKPGFFKFLVLWRSLILFFPLSPTIASAPW